MSGIWFTSDLHLGHAKVAQIRGFDSVIAHDLAIAENWARVVKPGDQVWVLGDVTSGSGSALAPALTLLDALPGEKHLVAGNHDHCHPMHRDAFRWQPRYLRSFASVQPFARRRIDGRQVLLSHFPYERDRDRVRYSQYRLRNEGMWLLHGHTHGPERATVKPAGATAPTEREIHVGLDAWDLQPVHLETVRQLITTEDQP